MSEDQIGGPYHCHICGAWNDGSGIGCVNQAQHPKPLTNADRARKRGKAHGREIAMELCPKCGQHGIIELSSRKVCLKCDYKGAK